MRLREFAPSPERDHHDDVPDPIFVLANRWWNATDRQPQIEHVLNSLGWSIHQVESEDDAVQLQHRDGTTRFISADEFDPDLDEAVNPNLRPGWERREHRGGLDLLASYNEPRGQRVLSILAYDRGGREIGNAHFEVMDDHLESFDTYVRPDMRHQGIATVMYDYAQELGNDLKPSGYQTRAGKQFWRARKQQPQAVAESQMVSVDSMINYIRKHHDNNLHSDYTNYITNNFTGFELRDIPVNTIKTDLPKLDPAKVEQYKKMDFSKAPPIVVGDGNILDGYHRANAAKSLGIPTIRAYVGVKKVNEISDELRRSYLDRAGRHVDRRMDHMARVRDRLNKGYEIYHADRPAGAAQIVDRFEANTPEEARRYYEQYIQNYESDRDFDLRLRRSTGIMEIARIPQGDYGDEGTLSADVPRVKKKPLPGGSGLTYGVNRKDPEFMEIMIFDGDTLAGELDLSATLDPLKTWRVESVVAAPDYTGRGIGKALYGIALTILKLTLETGETQTKHGQRMWIMLNSIPGVEVLGYAMEPTREYRAKPGDQIVDQNKTWTRYTFPVEPGRRSMRSTRRGTGIYSSHYVSMIARWTGR